MQNLAEQLEAEVGLRIAQTGSNNEFRESQQRVKDLVQSELNELNRFTEGKNELDAMLIAARMPCGLRSLALRQSSFSSGNDYVSQPRAS